MYGLPVNDESDEKKEKGDVEGGCEVTVTVVVENVLKVVRKLENADVKGADEEKEEVNERETD